MFLTWHLARHLQMSKQSAHSIPRIEVRAEQALSGNTNHRHVVVDPNEQPTPALKCNIHSPSKVHTQSHISAHAHAQMCECVLSAAVPSNIHLCNSACRGYFRGKLLIIPSVPGHRYPCTNSSARTNLSQPVTFTCKRSISRLRAAQLWCGCQRVTSELVQRAFNAKAVVLLEISFKIFFLS